MVSRGSGSPRRIPGVRVDGYSLQLTNLGEVMAKQATESDLRAFVRLSIRGRNLERAWDKAVKDGDEKKKAELNKKADAFYKAWEKYEAKGIKISQVRLSPHNLDVRITAQIESKKFSQDVRVRE
jgi:hypothetical protein